MRMDSEGEFWNLAAGAVIGGTISAVTQIVGNVVTGDSLSKGVIMETVTKLLSRAVKNVSKVGYKESYKTGTKFLIGCVNAQIWSRWEVK